MRPEEELMRGPVAHRLHAIKKDIETQNRREMTVDEFGALCGAERNATSNWLNGYNLPPVWRMIRLCEATGLTLDFIYRGSPGTLPTEKGIRLSAILDGMSPPFVDPAAVQDQVAPFGEAFPQETPSKDGKSVPANEKRSARKRRKRSA